MEFFKKEIIVARRKLSHLGLKSPKVECVGGEGRGSKGRYRFFGGAFRSCENKRLDAIRWRYITNIMAICEPTLGKMSLFNLLFSD